MSLRSLKILQSLMDGFLKMFEWISHETSSVQETVRLFEKGLKRTEIARLRKLKESTINDHLLKHLLLTKMRL